MRPETRNLFLEYCGRFLRAASWNFLTNHAGAAVHHPRSWRAAARPLGQPQHHRAQRPCDRRWPGRAGYLVKHEHGRRNRCQIQAHLPLPEPASREPAIGDVLALLAGDGAAPKLRESAAGHEHADMNDGNREKCPESS
jgi:hypothetical protein